MILNRPDSSKRPAADLGGKAAIDQIRRQMHGDESELEAAGEEAEHQQNVAAMAECFRTGMPRSDCAGLAAGRCPAGFAAASRARATAAGSAS